MTRRNGGDPPRDRAFVRRCLRPLVVVALLAAVCAASAAGAGGSALPPGEWIVFASDRDGDSELFAMHPDGTGRRRVTRNRVEDFFPVVSPDGAKIAFVSSRSGDDDIYAMNRDGTGLRPLTRNGTTADGAPIQDEAPSWSPDGRLIAFASNRAGQFEIYVMRADGTHVRRLTRTGPQVTDTIPAWSPDGRLIAFASDRVSPFNTEIYVMRPDGGGLRRLTVTGGADGVLGDDSMPSWSPDGSQIAFVSNRDQQNEIYVMAADGSDQRRVLSRIGTDDFLPRFSPDGTHLVFWSVAFDVEPALYTSGADGSDPRRIQAGSDGFWTG
jgi:Tol biopolymer transport system component